MKKAIIIIISVLLVLTTITIFALNKLGNEVIDSLIDSELASIEQTQEDIGAVKDSSDTTISGNQENNSESTLQTNSSINESTASENSVSNQNTNDAQDEATGTKVKEEIKPKVITIQKANEIKEQITATDKMTAATLALKRLSSEDIGELKSLMSGGLTAEKKKEAVKIAYARFSAEEIAQIKELYRKYMK